MIQFCIQIDKFVSRSFLEPTIHTRVAQTKKGTFRKCTERFKDGQKNRQNYRLKSVNQTLLYNLTFKITLGGFQNCEKCKTDCHMLNISREKQNENIFQLAEMKPTVLPGSQLVTTN